MILSTLTNADIYDTPPTATPEHKREKKLTSTVVSLALCGSLGHVCLLGSPTFQPSFVETEQSSIQHCESNEISIIDFDIDGDSKAVGEYFTEKPIALAFLSGVKSLIDQVYGDIAIRKTIKVLNDPDTNEPLMELVIQTNLPIDDAFLGKDRLLFEKIDQANLTEGLRHVVLSNG